MGVHNNWATIGSHSQFFVPPYFRQDDQGSKVDKVEMFSTFAIATISRLSFSGRIVGEVT